MAEIDALPRVHLIVCPTGSGKSTLYREMAVDMILPTMRDSARHQSILTCVPTHKLGDQFAERFNAYAKAQGFAYIARVWRSREAKAPDGTPMCFHVAKIKRAVEFMLDPEDCVCKACADRIECPFQKQKPLEADLWIISQSAMFLPLPDTVERRGLYRNFVDESPINAGIIDAKKMLLADLYNLPKIDMSEDRFEFCDRRDFKLDVERFAEIRRDFASVVANLPDGWVPRDALAAIGFDESTGEFAWDFEWKRRRTHANLEDNRNLEAMLLIWDAVRVLMGGPPGSASGRLEIVTRKKDGETIRRLRISGKRNVDATVANLPTILVDATGDIDLARYFWPQAELVEGAKRIFAPHKKIYRASFRRLFSKSRLATRDEDSDAAKANKAAERRELKAVLMRHERGLNGEFLAIGNKPIIRSAEMTFPPWFKVGHYNDIAGHDEWRPALQINVGQCLAPPKVVERLAGALTGFAPICVPIDPKTNRVGWYPQEPTKQQYRRPDGSIFAVTVMASRHPDPIAEKLRFRMVQGELLQAEGRARGHERTAADPCRIEFWTTEAVPFPIDGELKPEHVTATVLDVQIAVGGVAFTGPAAAVATYPEIFSSEDAFRKRRERESTAGHFLYKYIFIGNVRLWSENKAKPEVYAAFAELERQRLRFFTFQKTGERQKPQLCITDPRLCPDPRAFVEARLGPLARWEEITRAERVRRAAE